jgi:hypothetical protein
METPSEFERGFETFREHFTTTYKGTFESMVTGMMRNHSPAKRTFYAKSALTLSEDAISVGE